MLEYGAPPWVLCHWLFHSIRIAAPGVAFLADRPAQDPEWLVVQACFNIPFQRNATPTRYECLSHSFSDDLESFVGLSINEERGLILVRDLRHGCAQFPC